MLIYIVIALGDYENEIMGVFKDEQSADALCLELDLENIDTIIEFYEIK